MAFPEYLKTKLLPILISRTVVFFFLLCLVTLFLYGVGIIQGFIDSTQFSLLRFYMIPGVFLTTSSMFGVIMNFARFPGTRKFRYLLRAAGYITLTLFGVSTVLAVMFILAAASGNMGEVMT